MQYYKSHPLFRKQFYCFRKQFIGCNIRGKIQVWNHKLLLHPSLFSTNQLSIICKWWIKGQNKISEKVIYLKTCLIQKESTVSTWWFLKIGNVP